MKNPATILIGVLLLIGVLTGIVRGQSRANEPIVYNHTKNRQPSQALLSGKTGEIIALYTPADETIRITADAPITTLICMRGECRSMAGWIAAAHKSPQTR